MIPHTRKTIARYIERTASAALDPTSGLLRSEVLKTPPSGPDGLSTAFFISTCVYFHKIFESDAFITLANRFVKPLADLLSVRGGAGAEGAIFLFDTQIAVQALWRYYQATPQQADWPAYFTAADRVRSMAADVVATHGNAVVDRWNARVAPFLLKIYPYLPEPEASQLLSIASSPSFEAIIAGQSPDAGAALPTADILFAIEGLLQHEGTKYWQLVNAGRVLVTRQNEDGGFRSDGTSEDSPPAPPASAAQAIRLWASIDAAGFDAPIHKAAEYIDQRFDERGLRSSPEGGACPVIGSLQALQARAFQEHGANPVLLV